MRIALHVLGMLLLGLATLAVFAGVQQWRVHQQTAAVRSGPSAMGGASAARRPLDALATGIGASLRRAADELGRNLSAAASALDAAKRAADAGGLAFRYAHAFVMQARHNLQNGDPERARLLIEEAIAALRQVDAQGHGPQGALERYAGATLIDLRGERIGEVVGAERREGRAMVELSVGGIHDAAGFLDFGGRRVSVPVEALIFGKPRQLGPTLVAWTGARR